MSSNIASPLRGTDGSVSGWRLTLRRLSRIPILGFVFAWLADIIRLPLIHRHMASHISLALSQSAELRAHIARLDRTETAHVTRIEAQISDLHRMNEVRQNRWESLRTGLEGTVEELRRSATANHHDGQQSRQEISANRDEIANLKASLSHLTEELPAKTADILANRDEIANLKGSLSHLATELPAKAAADQQSWRQEILARDGEFASVKASLARIKAELTDARSQLREYEAFLGRWDAAADFVEKFRLDFAALQPEADTANQPAQGRPIDPALPAVRPWYYLGNERVLTAGPRSLQLICSARDLQITPQIAFHGVWEEMVTNLYDRILPAGASYLEIGANIGYFTTLAATYVGHYGSVVAFEPNPEAFQLLEQNLRINRQNYLATLKNLAVADRVGNRPFSAFKSNMASSTLSALDEALLGEMNERPVSIEVKCVTLDHEFADSDKKFDFVKIDAEGSEPLIVAGAKNFLEHHLRSDAVLLIEWNPVAMRGLEADGKAMLDTFSALGFSAFKICPQLTLTRVSGVHDLDGWRNADLLVTRAVDVLREKGLRIE